MYQNIIPVGRFGAPHGVKGWIRVISYTKPESQIVEYLPWKIRVQNTWREFNFIEHALWSKKLVVLPEGFNNRNQAEPLVNIDIGVSRDLFPALNEGYYWCDLEGLTVKTLMGIELGVVESLMATGANDVLIVKGKQEHLIPFVEPHIIKSVDLEARLIMVDWEPME